MSPPSQDIYAKSLDGSDSIEYQPVSLAATVACVLGVASLLALTGRYLWWVPVVAIVLAIHALRQIAISEEPLLGSRRAIIGFVAALFFGTWAWVADTTWQGWLQHEAEEKALLWLEVLRAGDVEKAQQLTLRYDRREPSPSPPSEPSVGGHAPHPHRPDRLELFLTQEATKLIQGAGPEAHFRTEKLLGIFRLEGADVVALRMRVDWTHDGRTQSQPLYVEMARFLDPQTKSAYWHVHKVELFKTLVGRK